MIAMLLNATLLLASAQTPVMPQSVAVTVPRWSTYEMTLTSTGQYDSAYVSVDLLGVFSGPDGSAIVVKGFWDGGKTFRIRFTPTIAGPWSFTTVSDDPGLDAHQGILTCVKPKEGLHGFVRLRNDVQGAWQYDDGSAVRDDVLSVTVAANTAGRVRADNRDGPATEPGATASMSAVCRRPIDSSARPSREGARLRSICLMLEPRPWTTPGPIGFSST